MQKKFKDLKVGSQPVLISTIIVSIKSMLMEKSMVTDSLLTLMGDQIHF